MTDEHEPTTWHKYDPPTKEEIGLAIYGSNDFIATFPHALQARVLLYLASQLVLSQEGLKRYADHLPTCKLRYGVPIEERGVTALACTCGFSEFIPVELEAVINARRGKTT